MLISFNIACLAPMIWHRQMNKTIRLTLTGLVIWKYPLYPAKIGRMPTAVVSTNGFFETIYSCIIALVICVGFDSIVDQIWIFVTSFQRRHLHQRTCLIYCDQSHHWVLPGQMRMVTMAIFVVLGCQKAIRTDCTTGFPRASLLGIQSSEDFTFQRRQ